ncbi:6-bladed beta-propeller [Echinicola rosea]|uniref:6-bladed beta-propeller n=1 Tax=Echinicola rosea TaxID=1807691 RepID=A0ABQ1UJ50_9BACT|nr:6-bladed beta-propeller [Echinicola rosea]GGF19151.1 hypothetical protein GCM10011339_03920 [Echinicola rosea]
MKFNLVFLLTACVFLFQCQKSTKTTSDIPVIHIDHDEKKAVHLEDFASDYVEIPLELTNSSMIKYVQDIAVSDEHLYIVDIKNGVLQFDLEGNFVKNIGEIGDEGPGTYFTPTSIAFDDDEHAVLISDMYRFSLHKFDTAGKLMAAVKKLPSNPIFIKNAIDGYQVVAEKFVNGDDGEYYISAEIFSTSEEFDIQKKIKVDHLKLNGSSGAVRSQPSLMFFSEYDSINYFYNPILLPPRAYRGKFIRDTLYQVENDRVLPKVRFEFSRKVWDGKEKVYHLRNVMAFDHFFLGQI